MYGVGVPFGGMGGFGGLGGFGGFGGGYGAGYGGAWGVGAVLVGTLILIALTVVFCSAVL